VPRKYATLSAAQNAADHLRTLAFFSRRGEPYAYACEVCACHHCGLHTGAPWHDCRDSHDNYLSFIGVSRDADAEAA
jgi:hypothetical protein